MATQEKEAHYLGHRTRQVPYAQNKRNIKDNSSQRTLTHLSLNRSDSTKFPKAEEVGSWEQGLNGGKQGVLYLLPTTTDAYHPPPLLTH